MNFSNLMKTTKEVKILGISVTLKKFSVGFFDYLSLKSLEIQDLNFNEKGSLEKVVKAPSPEALIEINAEKILGGVVSWDLKTEEGTHAEVSMDHAKGLLKDYPEFALLLIKEIDSFNTFSDSKKKSSKNS